LFSYPILVKIISVILAPDPLTPDPNAGGIFVAGAGVVTGGGVTGRLSYTCGT